MNQEQILEHFKETDALLEGHFILSSGLHSPKYLQCALRSAISDGRGEIRQSDCRTFHRRGNRNRRIAGNRRFDYRLRSRQSVKRAIHLDGTRKRRDDFAARFFASKKTKEF